jgi:hypothetical protein
VYVPEAVNLMIVLDPDVVIVGLPVVVPEYKIVGTDNIITPEPPAAPAAEPALKPLDAPPPPPVEYSPSVATLVFQFVGPPPPSPPVEIYGEEALLPAPPPA